MSLMAGLVAGIGCRRGVTHDDVLMALDVTLEACGCTRDEIRLLAAPIHKSTEMAIAEVAETLSVPLVFAAPMDAAAARAANVTPSPVVAGHLGYQWSPAEMAALAAAGRGSRLLAPRTIRGLVVCALARPAGASPAGTADEDASGETFRFGPLRDVKVDDRVTPQTAVEPLLGRRKVVRHDEADGTDEPQQAVVSAAAFALAAWAPAALEMSEPEPANFDIDPLRTVEPEPIDDWPIEDPQPAVLAPPMADVQSMLEISSPDRLLEAAPHWAADGGGEAADRVTHPTPGDLGAGDPDHIDFSGVPDMTALGDAPGDGTDVVLEAASALAFLAPTILNMGEPEPADFEAEPLRTVEGETLDDWPMDDALDAVEPALANLSPVSSDQAGQDATHDTSLEDGRGPDDHPRGEGESETEAARDLADLAREFGGADWESSVSGRATEDDEETVDSGANPEDVQASDDRAADKETEWPDRELTQPKNILAFL